MEVVNKKCHRPSDASGETVPRVKCYPIVRNEYRNRSVHPENTDDAILNDCKSLSCGFVDKCFNSDSKCIDEQNISSMIQSQRDDNDKLMNYISARVAGLQVGSTVKTSPVDVKDQTETSELYRKCANLPAQWNVIQISQVYNGYSGYATKKDIYSESLPIRLTLLRFNHLDKYSNSAVSFVMNLGEHDSKNVMPVAYDINYVKYKQYSDIMNTTKFATFAKNLVQTCSKLITDLALLFGPWITLFSGKIKAQNGNDFELKINSEVEKFSRKLNNFDQQQLLMLNLVARRIDLLKSEAIEQAAHAIGRNQDEERRIVQFLAQLKTKLTFDNFQYYPCILLVDEVLDPIPWEMILPAQEFTRAHSIYMLLDLYEKHKDSIVDGYLNVDVKNGFYLLNPDCDNKLDDMCNRMRSYYVDSLPKWSHMENEIPTYQQMADTIAANNIFVYSGHGSTLQFFSSPEYSALKNSCIMFLFGCESVAMRPGGTICEADSSSYNYFKSGCPTLLGTLTLVTDIWIDLICILILNQWVVPKQIKHPRIEICKDEYSKERANRILAKYSGKRSPNLLSLLCDIRNETEIAIQMRSAIVIRGLPLHNTSAGK